MIAVTTGVVALLIMVGESWLSMRHERSLRAKGAVEPSGDVYRVMQWAYPGSFVAMALEGVLGGPPPSILLVVGLTVFAVSKALKLWAIRTLGERWTFRVLVLPDAPLVAHGPYAFMRHPNYVAVLGEIAGVALIVGAPVTGLLAALGFGALMRQRIAIEDRALGRQ